MAQKPLEHPGSEPSVVSAVDSSAAEEVDDGDVVLEAPVEVPEASWPVSEDSVPPTPEGSASSRHAPRASSSKSGTFVGPS